MIYLFYLLNTVHISLSPTLTPFRTLSPLSLFSLFSISILYSLSLSLSQTRPSLSLTLSLNIARIAKPGIPLSVRRSSQSSADSSLNLSFGEQKSFYDTPALIISTLSPPWVAPFGANSCLE